MALKPKKIKNLKKEIPDIIRRDVEELNHLSDEDLLSLWTFFKFMITEVDKGDDMIFVTKIDSIIGKNARILEKKYGIKIEYLSTFIAG